MKKILLLVALMFFVFTKLSFASGFQVTSIGGVDTTGIQYGKFWHTSLAPTIRGVALPGANITIDIDGTPVAIAADSSGDWVYTPPVQTAGDHVFTFTASSTIKMTITLGSMQGMPLGGDSGTTSTIPAAGTSWPTVMILAVGGLSLLMALKYRNAKVLS